MGGHKVTKVVKAERVSQVLELLVLGLKPREIFRYVSEKTDWNITERQIENYIRDATDLIEESSKIRRDQEVGKAILRLEKLYTANMKIQDYKAALAVVKTRAELLGLNQPAKTAVTLSTAPQTWKDFIESGAGEDEDDSGESS